MTNEEAIKTIKLAIAEVEWNYPMDYAIAFETAISALDRITRQQAEIEQWKEEANKYQNLWCMAVDDIEKAKSEAYKEFAEKLTENLHDCDMVIDGYRCGYYCSDVRYEIDNLTKEMVGENNE